MKWMELIAHMKEGRKMHVSSLGGNRKKRDNSENPIVGRRII